MREPLFFAGLIVLVLSGLYFFTDKVVKFNERLLGGLIFSFQEESATAPAMPAGGLSMGQASLPAAVDDFYIFEKTGQAEEKMAAGQALKANSGGELRLRALPSRYQLDPNSLAVTQILPAGETKKIAAAAALDGLVILGEEIVAEGQLVFAYDYGLFNQTYSLAVADELTAEHIFFAADIEPDIIDRKGRIIKVGRRTRNRPRIQFGSEAEALTIDTSGARLVGAGKKLQDVYLINSSNGFTITVNKIRLAWGGASALKEITIDDAVVWDGEGIGSPSGNQNSPADIDIADFTIGQGAKVKMQASFTTSVSGSSFHITAVMKDGSTRSAVTGVLSRLWPSFLKTVFAKDDDDDSGESGDDSNGQESNNGGKGSGKGGNGSGKNEEKNRGEREGQRGKKKKERAEKIKKAVEMKFDTFALRFKEIPGEFGFPEETFFAIGLPAGKAINVLADSSVEIYQNSQLTNKSIPVFEYETTDGWQPYFVVKSHATYSTTPEEVIIKFVLDTAEGDPIFAHYRFGFAAGQYIAERYYQIESSQATRVNYPDLAFGEPVDGFWVKAPQWQLHFSESAGGLPDRFISPGYQFSGPLVVFDQLKNKMEPAAIRVLENSPGRIKLEADNAQYTINYTVYLSGQIYMKIAAKVNPKIHIQFVQPGFKQPLIDRENKAAALQWAFIAADPALIVEVADKAKFIPEGRESVWLIDFSRGEYDALALKTLAEDYQNPGGLTFLVGEALSPLFDFESGSYQARAGEKNGEPDINFGFTEGPDRYFPKVEIHNWFGGILPEAGSNQLVYFKNNDPNEQIIVFQYLGTVKTGVAPILAPAPTSAIEAVEEEEKEAKEKRERKEKKEKKEKEEREKTEKEEKAKREEKIEEQAGGGASGAGEAEPEEKKEKEAGGGGGEIPHQRAEETEKEEIEKQEEAIKQELKYLRIEIEKDEKGKQKAAAVSIIEKPANIIPRTVNILRNNLNDIKVYFKSSAPVSAYGTLSLLGTPPPSSNIASYYHRGLLAKLNIVEQSPALKELVSRYQINIARLEFKKAGQDVYTATLTPIIKGAP